jgi:hypothetical protein
MNESIVVGQKMEPSPESRPTAEVPERSCDHSGGVTLRNLPIPVTKHCSRMNLV